MSLKSVLNAILEAQRRMPKINEPSSDKADRVIQVVDEVSELALDLMNSDELTAAPLETRLEMAVYMVNLATIEAYLRHSDDSEVTRSLPPELSAVSIPARVYGKIYVALGEIDQSELTTSSFYIIASVAHKLIIQVKGEQVTVNLNNQTAELSKIVSQGFGVSAAAAAAAMLRGSRGIQSPSKTTWGESDDNADVSRYVRSEFYDDLP